MRGVIAFGRLNVSEACLHVQADLSYARFLQARGHVGLAGSPM